MVAISVVGRVGICSWYWRLVHFGIIAGSVLLHCSGKTKEHGVEILALILCGILQRIPILEQEELGLCLAERTTLVVEEVYFFRLAASINGMSSRTNTSETVWIY